MRGTATRSAYLSLSYLDSPEVTGTASTVSHHSSDDGAIAGGVVGGIAGAALITGIALWYILRRRRDRSVPLESMKFRTVENRQSTQVSTPLSSTLANEAPKLYVSVYSLPSIFCPKLIWSVYSSGPFGSNDLPEQGLLANEQSTPRLL